MKKAAKEKERVSKEEGGPMSMDDQMKAALVIPVKSEMESDDDSDGR